MTEEIFVFCNKNQSKCKNQLKCENNLGYYIKLYNNTSRCRVPRHNVLFTTVFVNTRLCKTKHPRKRFEKFPSVLRLIDRSDRNPPIAATSVTF